MPGIAADNDTDLFSLPRAQMSAPVFDPRGQGDNVSREHLQTLVIDPKRKGQGHQWKLKILRRDRVAGSDNPFNLEVSEKGLEC